MLNVVVMVSGGGTNLQAIIDNIESGQIRNARIAAVISNNANAYALERAKKHGIPAVCISPKDFSCFPVEKAREVYEAFQGLPGGLNVFSDGRALRDTAQQRFFDERFARLAAVRCSAARCSKRTQFSAV